MKTDLNFVDRWVNRLRPILPVLLPALVLVSWVCAVKLRDHSSWLAALKRFEWIAYDRFVRSVAAERPRMDPRLTGVFIDDIAIKQLNSGLIRYGDSPLKCELPWPRFVYGLLLRELTSQGAAAVGFDVLFDQTFAPATNLVESITGQHLTSDEFFAQVIAQGTNVVLASEGDVLPAELFIENGGLVGNILAHSDDGILRRAAPFVDRTNRVWHPDLVALSRALELDLARAKVFKDRISIPAMVGNLTLEDGKHEILLHPDGTMNLEGAGGAPGELPSKPFTDRVERVWHMGILLASKAMGLDLDHAQLASDRLIIPGPKGVTREIPLDRDGTFYIDWIAKSSDIVNKDPNRLFELLLWDAARELARDRGGDGDKEPIPSPFRNKLVVVGSIGTGNNIADHGATPLEDQALLVTKHLCVANSVLTGRFVRFYSSGVEILLLSAFTLFSASVTWRQRAVTASLSILFVGLAYVALGQVIFHHSRYYLPMMVPILGGLLSTHLVLATYRVVFEQREQRRLKSVFNRLVAPEVVNELLKADALNLGGSRRRITVLFADVRGFTEFTDARQARAEEWVLQNQLSSMEAEAHFDAQARETLATVNLYLATIADTVKRQGGTLDKYIGDCVMAFWGAPIANPRHATDCVHAAIEVQRALAALNESRAQVNRDRALINQQRTGTASLPLEPLPILSCGTGINTGLVTVGLMGSDSHFLNYTVFGREVNLASRLEGVSGRARIVIGEATLEDLRADDPELAARCEELAPESVKGFRHPVKIFRVPWERGEDGKSLQGPPSI